MSSLSGPMAHGLVEPLKLDMRTEYCGALQNFFSTAITIAIVLYAI